MCTTNNRHYVYSLSPRAHINQINKVSPLPGGCRSPRRRPTRRTGCCTPPDAGGTPPQGGVPSAAVGGDTRRTCIRTRPAVVNIYYVITWYKGVVLKKNIPRRKWAPERSNTHDIRASKVQHCCCDSRHREQVAETYGTSRWAHSCSCSILWCPVATSFPHPHPHGTRGLAAPRSPAATPKYPASFCSAGRDRYTRPTWLVSTGRKGCSIRHTRQSWLRNLPGHIIYGSSLYIHGYDCWVIARVAYSGLAGEGGVSMTGVAMVPVSFDCLGVVSRGHCSSLCGCVVRYFTSINNGLRQLPLNELAGTAKVVRAMLLWKLCGKTP